MTRKGRRLSPEEEKLWKKITDTATPIARRAPTYLKPMSEAKADEAPKKEKLLPFRVGERASAPRSETRLSLPDQPLRMDRKAFTKLKRGKSAPESRIDLHGMTADSAHQALLAFLFRAQAEGKRLVLVITGKGRGGEPGVLKRQVPHWLELPPLRQIVLQTTPAHQRHGGSGALYVYLRR